MIKYTLISALYLHNKRLQIFMQNQNIALKLES